MKKKLESFEGCLLTKQILNGDYLSNKNDSLLTIHLKNGCRKCEEKLKNYFTQEIELINNCSSETRAIIIWGVLMQMLPRPVRLIFYQHFKKCFFCKSLFIELTNFYKEKIIGKNIQLSLRKKIAKNNRFYRIF